MSSDNYLWVFQWGDQFDLCSRHMSVEYDAYTQPPPAGSQGRYPTATEAVVFAHLREERDAVEYGVVLSPEVMEALKEEWDVSA